MMRPALVFVFCTIISLHASAVLAVGPVEEGGVAPVTPAEPDAMHPTSALAILLSYQVKSSRGESVRIPVLEAVRLLDALGQQLDTVTLPTSSAEMTDVEGPIKSAMRSRCLSVNQCCGQVFGDVATPAAPGSNAALFKGRLGSRRPQGPYHSIYESTSI